MRVRTDFTEIENLDRELQYLKTHYVVVGVLGEEFINDIPILKIAIWNEYGTQNIPARPFFRYATKSKNAKDEIANKLKEEVEEVINGRKTGKQALNSVGIFTKGKIKSSIVSGPWKPNADTTSARKGKNTPLRDTGTLLKSIDYEIRRK